jgi:hypothetical protein
MNPSTTIGYMAAQAKQRQVERGAARGWMAEQAAAQRDRRRSTLAGMPRRWTAGMFAAPLRAIRAMTRIVVPAATTTPRLDRAG